MNVLDAAELRIHLENVNMENFMLRTFCHDSRVLGAAPGGWGGDGILGRMRQEE